jgi:hypothetical protein
MAIISRHTKIKNFQQDEGRLNHFKARENISMHKDWSNYVALKTSTRMSLCNLLFLQ